MQRVMSVVAFLLPIAVIACGKDSNSGGSVPAVFSTTSCDYATTKTCLEFYTAAASDQYKTSCTQGGGVFSANSACKSAGKIKGCQQSFQGVKTLTTWAYDQTSVALIEQACSAAVSNSSGATTTIVTP